MTLLLTAALPYERQATMSIPVANRTRCESDGVLWALGRLAHQKDVQAWSVLVAQVGPDVHRLAMRMSGNYALAEDIVQETFLLVRDCADRFIVRDGDGDDYARRWIMGVATNASLHMVRRYRRELHRDARAGRAAAQTATPVISPAQQAEDADENRLLRRELAELPTVYGQALTLHNFAGQDYPELASLLRVSVNTVRSRVHRGLKALRERLDRCGVTLSIAALTGLLSHLGAASTVGGAATVSASTLGLISSTAVPTTSFLVASGGMTMAKVLTIFFAALLAVVVLSGVYLSSFSPRSTPPQIVEVVKAAEVAEVVNNARVTPFILVVKTDQMVEKNSSAARSDAFILRIADEEKFFLTSGPDQFRLPLQLFDHYDFTIDWGDGTTEVVRSDMPAGQAIIDEAWLAQVNKGLAQPVTVDFEKKRNEFPSIDNSDSERCLRYLLEIAGMDLCANTIVDPKILAKKHGDKLSTPTLQVAAMTLGEVLQKLTKITGLTYVLHDRALLITERKDLPRLVCPQHTYAQAGTYQVKITENIVGGFPQVYFNRGYDCVKVMDLAQWGGNTWTSLDAAFRGCVNMTISASDTATAATGAVKEFRQAWSGCRGLTSFPLLNTSAGTNFQDAWRGCRGLTSFPLLNTSAGTNFFFAWGACHGLTNFPLLNTSAGKNFRSSWRECSGLTSFPLLDTSAGNNFDSAWRDCYHLTSFPLLNISAGTTFQSAWYQCSGLTSFPLLDTSAGTDFSVAWGGCFGLTSFPLLDTSAGIDFKAAWLFCSGLTSFPLLSTAAGTDFSSTWCGCSGLTSFPLLDTSAGIDFGGSWVGCLCLTSFPLLDTSAGKSFKSAWYGCSGLTNFPLLNTSAGTDFSNAWSGCSGLKNFPLLNFGKMDNAVECFSGVTLTSASYGELLSNIAGINKVSNVEFDGGFSKANGLIGIQAREKMTKKLGWTIYDGDHPKPKPAPKKAPPADPQPKPEAVNDF
jgi:RNA polymerase sigma factor (sigma-70 family)